LLTCTAMIALICLTWFTGRYFALLIGETRIRVGPGEYGATIYVDTGWPYSTAHPDFRGPSDGLPCWFYAAFSGVIFLYWLGRRIQDRRRPVPGICQRCGYDLRATPDRCPECGTVRKDMKVSNQTL
jgi:hypothetical protein